MRIGFKFVSLFAVVTFVALASWARAQTNNLDPSRLDELSSQQSQEAAREQALMAERARVQSEITSLKTDMIGIAKAAKALEETSRDLREKLAALEIEASEMGVAVQSDRRRLQYMLGALQRIEMNPPPALAVTPEDAQDVMISGRYVTGISLEVEQRIARVNDRLEEVAIVRQEISVARDNLLENEKKLALRREDIKTKVSEKSRLEASIAEDQASVRSRLMALANEADDLRSLIQSFEQSTMMVVPRLKPPKGEAAAAPAAPTSPNLRRASPLDALQLPGNSAPFSQAKARVIAPVTGRVSKTYTTARKGMTVTTDARAQVLAPYYGRIEFAGPFKNYDNVVIVNFDDGYFILLTGLGEIYVEAGDIVSPGEPVGLMPFNTPGPTELYIELRKDGTTINPNPWLGTAFAG